MPRRLLIIGLDGLNWQILEPLIAADAVPHLARLRREGAWGPLASVIPTQSATAWSSFITGQNPARHGVFDFAVRQEDGSYRHAKPHPATTLWHYAGCGGLRVGVLNFPVTYPPDPVAGFLVSGMLSPQGREFTYPPSLGAEMLAAVPGYRLDLGWQLYRGREQTLVREATEMTRKRLLAARYLQDRYTPDLLAVAFIGPDRLQHVMWRTLEQAAKCEQQPTRQQGAEGRMPGGAGMTAALYEFYRALDDAVGELVAASGEGTSVFLLSDHGFQRADWQFRVDNWLAEHGWLAWQRGRSRLERFVRRIDTPWVRHVRRRLVKDISRHFSTFSPGGVIDWDRTVAFCPWPAQQGVRLNVQGREPQGIVPPGAAYERLREEISQALLQAAEPRTGLRAIDRVWRREELYEGPFFEQMPDLVFSTRPGFASSPVAGGLWTSTGWASGDHSLEGFFVAWGAGIAAGPVTCARLIDLAPTALYLLGQAVPVDMDGDVLVEALDPALLSATTIRREAGRKTDQDSDLSRGDGSDPSLLTVAEEAELHERLRGLGYL